MKTIVKMDVKKAITIAKPFVGGFTKKEMGRPVLKTAMVTDNHVVATNAHILIKIKHTDSVSESYLHHYKPELTGMCEVKTYPNVDRLFPEKENARNVFQIPVKEWLEIHEMALVAAKEHKNKVITLDKNKFDVKAATERKMKGSNKYEAIPEFEQISFTHTLDKEVIPEKVAYNCKYMLIALNAFQKVKEQTVTCYYYGHLQPIYFVSDMVEVILLPVKTY